MRSENGPAGATVDHDDVHDHAVVVVDDDFDVVSVRGPVSGLLGADAPVLVGENLAELIHPDDRARAHRAVGELLGRRGARPPGVYRLARADGTWCSLEVWVENLGPGLHAHCLQRLDDRRRAEAVAVEQIEVMEQLAAGGSLDDCLGALSGLAARHLEGSWVVLTVEDGDRPVGPLVVAPSDCPDPLRRRASDPDRHLFDGRRRAGANGTAAVSERSELAGWEDLAEVMDDHGIAQCVTWPIVSPGRGVVGFAEVYGATAVSPDGPEWRIHELVVRLASLMIAQLSTSAEAERTSIHDPLTGVANRRLLTSLLHELAARGRPYAVMSVDVDQFGWVNDSLGHDAGDRLLVAVAERLAAAVPAEAVVARHGGDEFVVLLAGQRQVEEVVELARHLCAEARRPVELAGTVRQARVSIGVAITAGDPDPSRPLAQSDRAMRAAKHDGGDGVRVFDPSMGALLTRQLTLADQLEFAIADGQLRLAYQPVVRLGSGVVSGLEALVRWDHPRFGLLTPEHFVPLAEELGVIALVDEWVMAAAWRQLQLWQPLRPGHDPLTMWVNMSARNLMRREAVERLVEMMAADPAPGLGVEINERDVIADVAQAAWSIHRMREVGVPVALDDFGAPSSSLEHLARLEVNHLKIERSFTAKMAAQPRHRAIFEVLVELGRRLECHITAKGVERQDQLAVLRLAGCESAQGFLLARPMVSSEVLTLLGEDLMGRLVETDPHLSMPAASTKLGAGR